MTAVTVKDLKKSYGEVQAVKGISFDIPEGTFFAFLGPNGAGKSTTISIIASLLSKDSGEVTVFGCDPSSAESKMNTGIVFQDPKMDKILTVRENISTRGAMYGLSGETLKKAVDEVIALTECTEFADRKYGNLSGGQRRRADIARALVHSPKLLILDEPTTGLDPKTRVMIWELINDLNKKGLTVLLTTHYMEEAAGADEILIINRGSIAARGTPAEIKDAHSSDRLTFVPKDLEKAEKTLTDAGITFTTDRTTVTIKLARTSDSVPIIGLLGDNMDSLEVRTGTLDEAFINITEATE